MTLRELETEYRNRIDPQDFPILAAHALGREKEFVMREPDLAIGPETEAALRDLLNRRMRHEPVAYLVGHREFYGLDFRVTRDTLIPRPETEHLVDAALGTIREAGSGHPGDPVSVCDIGTGSGAIVISIAKTMEEREGVTFFASDISEAALDVARENAAAHGLVDRIVFLQGDLFDPFRDEAPGPAGTLVVTANLPYLSDERYASAPQDVRKYEPESALRADRDGLALYDGLLRQLAAYRNGKNMRVIAFLEIDPEQAGPIRPLIAGHIPDADIDILPDLAGRARVVRICIPLLP